MGFNRRKLEDERREVPREGANIRERLPAALARLALLLSCILFRRRIHESIETVQTLVLFLYETAIFHFLYWGRNLLGCWRYFLIIAVQAFLALIFNLKAGPQCL